MFCRGDVHVGSRTTFYRSMGLYLIVDLGILIYAIILGNWILPLVFIIIHLAYVLPPLRTAIRMPEASRIGTAVKHGVLGMILMDAICVSFSPFWCGAIFMKLLLSFYQRIA